MVREVRGPEARSEQGSGGAKAQESNGHGRRSGDDGVRLRGGIEGFEADEAGVVTRTAKARVVEGGGEIGGRARATAGGNDARSSGGEPGDRALVHGSR